MTIRELHFPADVAFYVEAFEWRQRYELDAWEEFVPRPAAVRDFGIFADDGVLLGVAVLIHYDAHNTEAGLIVPPRPRLRWLLTAYQHIIAEFFTQNIGTRLFTETQPTAAHRKLMQVLGWREVGANLYEFTREDHEFTRTRNPTEN